MRLFEFVERLANAVDATCESEAFLPEIADLMRSLAAGLASPLLQWPAAERNQEVAHELGEVAARRGALYLVSDAPGITSPPHEHGTWAIIVGLRGVEVNTLYRIIDPQHRKVEVIGEVAVAAGETLVLPADSIHSTAVLGTTATYHLHLYGRSLRMLPPFRDRTYSVAG